MDKPELIRKQVLLDKTDSAKFQAAASKTEKGSLSQLIRQAMKRFIKQNPKQFEL